MDWLTNRGFLERDDKIYKTTASGVDLLANLIDISSMISADIDKDLLFDPDAL